MIFKIFNYIIKIEKVTKKENIKSKQAWEKIERALQVEKESENRLSEYKLQKLSQVSINTIKKYRSKIELWRENNL